MDNKKKTKRTSELGKEQRNMELEVQKSR